MQTPWFSIAAVVISLAALLVAFRNYRRKAGVLMRGSFSIASSIDCNDRYVSHVTLENMKDRAVTIYAVYLQIGYAYSIQLESFEDQPILLKPYETYHKNFGPIEFYAVSTKKIDLNAVLEDAKVRKRLVLSTGDGRYVVPSYIPRWNPVVEMFRNNFFGVIHPVESRYKGTYVGSENRFVIEFKTGAGSEIVPVRPQDFEHQKFKNFRLTQQSLASKDALVDFLESKRTEGVLVCDDVSVHDMDAWRAKEHTFYSGRTIVGKRYGWLTYHLLGRALSKYQDFQMRRSNRKHQRTLRDSRG